MDEYEHHYLSQEMGNLSQELVARCLRDGEQLYLIEIWIKTSDGIHQSKVKINLPALAKKIENQESKLLVDDVLDIAFQEFDEVLEEEVKQVNKVRQMINTLKQEHLENQTNELISAAEAALSAHPTNQSIEEIVEQITKSPKR